MVALNGFECLAQAGRELHTSALQRKGKRTHVYTHQAPLSSHPGSPSWPLSTHSGLGLQPMNEGWVLGGSALLLPGVDWLWSWLSASGSCQEPQREMDEPLRWLLGIGLWCVSGDWWVNTAPPAPQVKLMHPHHKTTILSWGSDMLKRKGRVKHQAFCKRSRCRRVAAWESRLHHWVFCCRGSNHWKSFTAAQWARWRCY